MNKQTVRSFSLGILFAAISLWIYGIFFSDQDVKSAEKLLEKNGMTVVKSEEWEQVSSLKEEINNLKKRKQELVKENSSLKNQLKEIESQIEDNIEPIIIEIKQNMTLEEISKLLENVKIVDDAQAFARYMIDEGLDRTIQIGEYELYQNMSYDSIGKLISKP